MTIPSRTTALALSLVALFVSSSACATKQASAGISNVQFHLIDLDPNDGVTPEIQFYMPYTYDGHRFEDTASGTWNYEYVPHYDLAPYSSTYQTAVDISRSMSTGGTGSSLSLNSQLLNRPEYASMYHMLETSSYFHLSANTALELSFHAAADISRSGNSHPDKNLSYSSAMAAIYDASFGNDYQRTGSIANMRGNDLSAAAEGDYLLRYDNLHNIGGDGVLYFDTVTTLSDTGTLTPVPEPESWALMLGGLSVLGWWARRRNKA